MSADNMIAILITSDKYPHRGTAYRVAHMLAPSDYSLYREKEPHSFGALLWSVFGDSKAYYNEDDAMRAADELYAKIGYAEYGIVILDERPMNFPFH